ncbi:putative Nuclease sbcCD subunit D [delta proteobacterium NaphS2]|nr:putative Nuclease sbcCD subunit D [delta proteobacterium NaphS2]
MKILHTSDWHLGRSLYGRKRYDEFTEFLNWLGDTVEKENIDVLLVAGDVFDTSVPSNRAQELYYRFICRMANSCCRHIVVIAGNHDSPSFLNAPKELLRALNVFVVGAMTKHPEEEVIVLNDDRRNPEAIICAVPYLRDRDIRSVEPGESIDDKNAKLALGLMNHYVEVCAIAEQEQARFKKEGYGHVPIVAMGHLFAAGGETVDGDGVRELYVGSLAHVGKDAFPSAIDYLALGHLHVPQCVANDERIRYCGSPIPMGYGDATNDKKVIVVRYDNSTPAIEEIKVPCFQPLERITGSFDEINAKIEQLKQAGSRAWLEIEYTGADLMGNLRELLEASLDGSSMEIRRIKNNRIMDRVFKAIHTHETLDDLDVDDVFDRCLDIFEVSLEDRLIITRLYNEIVTSIREEDVNEE